MKIFGDFIDDKIFPKANKKFTDEEKDLIDQFVELIYKNFKNAEIKHTHTQIYHDDRYYRTESISKDISIKNKKLLIMWFYKIYCPDKKAWWNDIEQGKKGERAKDIIVVGESGFQVDWEGKEKEFDEFRKKNKLISGIWCQFQYADKGRIVEESIPTKYIQSSGVLTKDTKENAIKKYFPRMITKLKTKIK